MIGTQRRPSEKHGMSFEKWNPEFTEFQPHPLSIDIYGEPQPSDDLVESIEQLGLVSPIVVWKKFIVSGNNRWAAMKQLSEKYPENKKFLYIPTTTFDGTDLEAEQLVIESNRQRIKTESQKDAEAAALLRIERELAAERQRRGGKDKVRQNSTEPSKAVERVAVTTGESTDTVRKRAEIHAANVPPAVRNQQSTNHAYENLPKPTECDICHAGFESKGAMKAHRKKEHAEEMAQRKPSLPMRGPVEEVTAPPSLADSTSSTPLQDSNLPKHKNGNPCGDCRITLNNRRGYCKKHGGGTFCSDCKNAQNSGQQYCEKHRKAQPPLISNVQRLHDSGFVQRCQDSVLRAYVLEQARLLDSEDFEDHLGAAFLEGKIVNRIWSEAERRNAEARS